MIPLPADALPHAVVRALGRAPVTVSVRPDGHIQHIGGEPSGH
jgi:hypothetical protein